MNELTIRILYLYDRAENLDRISKLAKHRFIALPISQFNLEQIDFKPSLVILDLLDNETAAIIEKIRNFFQSTSFLLLLKDGFSGSALESALKVAPAATEFFQINFPDWVIKGGIDTSIHQWFEKVNPHKVDFDPKAPVLAVLEPTARLVEQGDWLCIWADRYGWTENDVELKRLRHQYKNNKSGFTQAIAQLEDWSKISKFMSVKIIDENIKQFKDE